MRNANFILWRALVSIPIAAGWGALAFNQWGFSPLITSITSFILGAVSFYSLGRFADARLYKKYGLSRKEYYYILDNLKEAHGKLSRLQKGFIKVRSISSFKQMIELNRLVRRIFSIVKKEPQRFYEAETFFYSHLDSVVELSEKYAALNSHKIKNESVKQSLIETQDTLDDLTKILENDLHKVLAKDIEHLTFELDVAKHSLKKRNLIEPNDKRRV
ncbi:5-bromo-4-chloroindolyl phosphate hydrolysis family protein [Bacillus sp. REN10]|uniref:5-bromo-4-chloroindolyl phosphate hydrolysis family protein n=1 Tax=Bacillus sp. REN10 TaxID=2782541 RepID=UPI00193BC17F|nr:5-bromo-4-chloroindolyl phosphate hydrolysis family protein [Bacillus sp. REN10]